MLTYVAPELDAQAHELLKFVLFGHDESEDETPVENHGLWDTTGEHGAPVGASCVSSLSTAAVCMYGDPILESSCSCYHV